MCLWKRWAGVKRQGQRNVDRPNKRIWQRIFFGRESGDITFGPLSKWKWALHLIPLATFGQHSTEMYRETKSQVKMRARVCFEDMPWAWVPDFYIFWESVSTMGTTASAEKMPQYIILPTFHRSKIFTIGYADLPRRQMYSPVLRGTIGFPEYVTSKARSM